jgi:hypothetical protein
LGEEVPVSFGAAGVHFIANNALCGLSTVKALANSNDSCCLVTLTWEIHIPRQCVMISVLILSVITATKQPEQRRSGLD